MVSGNLKVTKQTGKRSNAWSNVQGSKTTQAKMPPDHGILSPTDLVQKKEEEKEETQAKMAIQNKTPEEEEPIQGKIIQKQPEEEEKAQAKMAIQKKGGPEEEELLQGKIIQKVEDEEPMQGKIIQKVEDEEPMQGKIIQKVEDEEPMQGKIIQKVEDEEPMQGKIIQKVEDEEPMQGKIIQKVEDEEPMQGKIIQKVEDEEPMQGKIIQKSNPEEEEVQGKFATQKKDTAEVQLKSESKASGSGHSVPYGVRGAMEGTLGTSFSDVKIHPESNNATKIGALAYTAGKDIHFAPGQYKPDTPKGQQLLGHELTHVVQQQEGRVKPNTNIKGMPVNDDHALETEADNMGAKAAKQTLQHKEEEAT